MKKILFFSLFFYSVSSEAQKTVSIDSIMQLHAAENFSGVVLVAENGGKIYNKAFGYRDFAQKIPLETTDIFELASISKTFTAMIIMMLAEKGKLHVDDLVEKYLDIPYKGITIRNLLNHTSGLPDYQEIMDKYWDKSKVAGNKEILEYLNKYAPPKQFEPGEKYEYSNTGYVLLASIAEKSGNKDFINMCRRWIFKPLKMRNTDLRSLKEKRRTKNFAIGHIYVPEKQQFVRADSFRSSDYTIWLGNREGPGRVSSTAADLLKWDQALYTNKLVQQSTLQEAFQPTRLVNDSLSNYGFGWMLEPDPPVPPLGKSVYHTGDKPGYATRLKRYLDKRKTIILLSNNGYGYLYHIQRAIEVTVFDKP